MPVVDAQLHCFERNHPGRPWTGRGGALQEATGERTITMMDTAGVDRAILVSPWLNYLADSSYAFEVAERFPGRFAVVAPIDLHRPDPVSLVAEVASHRYGAGLRQMLWAPEARTAVATGVLDPVLAGMQEAGLPLCLALGPGVEEVRVIAARFPGLTVVIDHLGLPNSPVPPAPDDPFARLDEVLALATFPEVHVKATGLPALSHEAFPYPDLHEQLRRVLDAFGPSRVLWGTDWTRVQSFLDYREGVEWILDAGLSTAELELVRGGNAARIFLRGQASRAAGLMAATHVRDGEEPK